MALPIRLTALLALVIAALSVACAQPAAPPAASTPGKTAATPAAGATTQPQAKPTGPQTITVGIVSVGNTPDLYDLGAQSSRNWRYHVGQLLVQLTTGEPTGQLVSSFRATDPTTWEFKLGDHRFSNGEKVTADDVVFSYQRATSTTNNAPNFPLLVGALGTVESVTATAPDTVQMKTRGPDPILPNKLATVFILSKKAFDTLPVEQASQIGPGPFKLQSLTRASEAILVQNEHFTGTKPNLTQITFKEIPDVSTRMAALQSNDVDAVEAIGLNNAKGLREPYKPVVRAADLVTGTIFDVRAPELKPREVRYGLNFAVDRQGIINAFMDGKVDPANQIVIKSTFGHNPNLPPFTFDVNRARQLIAQGGFPNGFNTKIGYAPIVADYKNFAEAIQQGFAQAGVRAEIELIDPAQFIPRYLALTLPVPIYMSSFSSSNYLDALEAMRFRSVPPTNAYYGNAAFDALFNQASAEIDRTRRQQILQEAMKMSHEDPPGLLGWGFAEAWGVGPRLRGFDSLPPTQLPQWQTMFRQN